MEKPDNIKKLTKVKDEWEKNGNCWTRTIVYNENMRSGNFTKEQYKELDEIINKAVKASEDRILAVLARNGIK